MTRINIGCGRTPTAGWVNYDNSPTVRLAHIPVLGGALGRLVSPARGEFMAFVRRSDIRYANAARHIPHADGSVDVVYASHMLEHLDRDEAARFLREVWRVLVRGGIIRLVVPDLRFHADHYVAGADADAFVAAIGLGRTRPVGIGRRVLTAVTGDRDHHWMYDGPSLSRLLTAAGFVDVRVVPAGTTAIPDPGALNLTERSEESVYVEARHS